MMALNSISLLQFRNYEDRIFHFTERIIGICGKNSAGKTNLLDAIHYLCFGKSHFTRLDSNNVLQGRTGFRLEGHFESENNPGKTICVLREAGRKELSVNDQVYEKFSQHIGRYPCVMIAPDDAQLVTGVSQERRKFLDVLICQLDAGYLHQLIRYKKVLEQRNSLLRSYAETRSDRDLSLLDVLDEQLIKPGSLIFQHRKEFLISFLPLVNQLYQVIARQPDDITLIYESELLQSSFRELLQGMRQKDCLAQRTTTGIHRDDLEIQLDRQLFRNIASQGQRKSLLFALKLAEMEVLKKEKGFSPLLLLDDVFEKLDEDRIANLLQMVCMENDGQVFITDTNKERLKSHLESISVNYQLIAL